MCVNSRLRDSRAIDESDQEPVWDRLFWTSVGIFKWCGLRSRPKRSLECPPDIRQTSAEGHLAHLSSLTPNLKPPMVLNVDRKNARRTAPSRSCQHRRHASALARESPVAKPPLTLRSKASLLWLSPIGIPAARSSSSSYSTPTTGRSSSKLETSALSGTAAHVQRLVGGCGGKRRVCGDSN